MLILFAVIVAFLDKNIHQDTFNFWQTGWVHITFNAFLFLFKSSFDFLQVFNHCICCNKLTMQITIINYS